MENVLQFSRSTAQGVAVHAEHTDIGALVRDAAAELETSVNAERRIAVHAASATYALVDRDAIRQAMVNLLDNAWKYGGVDQPIAVRVTSAGDELRIGVSDAGPGIPERDRLRVWTRMFDSIAIVARRLPAQASASPSFATSSPHTRGDAGSRPQRPVVRRL